MANGRNSVMVHNFSQVPEARIPRSMFNRAHGVKTTFNAGYLIPVYVDEALPGDTFNLRMTSFARLSTPIVPIMDNLFLESFFFAVPYRLVWSHWEKFNGAQDNPGDSISYTIPTTTATAGTGYGEMSLQDYMGIPTKVASLVHNNLHCRAYNLIWNTWFRDQNLQNSVTVDTGDGPDTSSNYVLLQRGKRHDYFTSCLPWPQKGSAVSMPLGTIAPVRGIAVLDSSTTWASNQSGLNEYGDTTGPRTYAHYATSSATNTFYIAGSAASGAHTYPAIYADLSSATAATINQLRQSFQTQKLLERDARGGTRYTEILRSHFGVISPDARLQRPEYLGGGRSAVNINPVAQTSGTSASGTTTPLGNLAAFGTIVGRGHGFVKSFTEHCLLIGLVNVRADLSYQQGMNVMWNRQTRYDYYWPAFSHIGEQSVLNKEIYCDGSGNDALVFGYQERYAEYRYKPSLITGQFRSNSATPLDYWHLAQKFSSLPSLGSAFIVDAPPMSRILAAGSTGPHFFFDAYFDLKCARPMPVYSVPGMIDHF